MKLSDSKNEILVSVSLCLFCYNENEKKVLTVRNKNLPFKNALVLPNKLLKYNQSLDEVCTRVNDPKRYGVVEFDENGTWLLTLK